MSIRRKSRSKSRSLTFELPVNGRSYIVSATPYIVATGDMLYRISYNNGPVHIFGWDEGLARFAATDDQADVIPPIIEMSISEKLRVYAAQMQHAA